MLGIVSMAGNALKAFGNTHPAIRWGVIVLAFLLAAEFVATEGGKTYVFLSTITAQITKTKADAAQSKAQAAAMSGSSPSLFQMQTPRDDFGNKLPALPEGHGKRLDDTNN
jgi:hypothetical protein